MPKPEQGPGYSSEGDGEQLAGAPAFLAVVYQDAWWRYVKVGEEKATVGLERRWRDLTGQDRLQLAWARAQAQGISHFYRYGQSPSDLDDQELNRQADAYGLGLTVALSLAEQSPVNLSLGQMGAILAGWYERQASQPPTDARSEHSLLGRMYMQLGTVLDSTLEKEIRLLLAQLYYSEQDMAESAADAVVLGLMAGRQFWYGDTGRLPDAWFG